MVTATLETADTTPSNNGAYVPEAFQPKGFYTRDRTFSAAPSPQHGPTDSDIVGDGIAGTNIDDEAALPLPLEPLDAPWFELSPMECIPSEADILDHDVHLLHKAHHADPFSVLGPHLFDLPGEAVKCLVVR